MRSSVFASRGSCDIHEPIGPAVSEPRSVDSPRNVWFSSVVSTAELFERLIANATKGPGRTYAFSLTPRLIVWVVCTENLIRVDDVMESPKLVE